MTKRLQVLIEEAELAEFQRIARRRHMTTAEWVRQSLRAARDTGVASTAHSKLGSVMAAAEYSFPVGDIQELLAEIERGYLGDGPERAGA